MQRKKGAVFKRDVVLGCSAAVFRWCALMGKKKISERITARRSFLTSWQWRYACMSRITSSSFCERLARAATA